jgi:SAM-dependent methyltransferase
MTSTPPRLFDRGLHRRRLARAARGFAGAQFLKARASEDVAERLAAINRPFPIAIELGARNGVFGAILGESPAAGKIGRLIESDLSEAMLRGRAGARVVADEAAPPFAVACADLIVSTLALHWVDDLVGALVQIRRTLKPDGLFLGAMLGGGTLSELRQALTEADLEQTGGAAPRVSPFIDAAHAGDLLRRAGFALPVVDVDRLTVRYAHPLNLMADLRAMGETNVLFERARAPLGRARLARAAEIYAERFAAADGRIPATFEIITLTAWAPHPDQPRPLARGTATARLDEALAAARRASSRRHSAGAEGSRTPKSP